MKKLIVTIVATFALMGAWATVTTDGKNISVSGEGNVLELKDQAELEVTMPTGAAANMISSSGATMLMKGGSLTLGTATESWKDKVAVWLDASKTETIEYYDATTTFDGRRKLLRWRDCREECRDGWRMAAPYQVQSGSKYSTSPTYAPAANDGDIAYVCFNKYVAWGSRAAIFNASEDPAEAGKSVNTWPTTKLTAKVMIAVFSCSDKGCASVLAGKPRATVTTPPIDNSVGIFSDNTRTYLDGASINPTTTGLKSGWQIVSVAPESGTVDASSFRYAWSKDGTTYYGGQNYAEILIFTNELTMLERVSAERYLAKKYELTYSGSTIANEARVFGTGSVAVSDGTAAIGGSFAGTINVAAGASVNFTDTKVAPTAPAVVENNTQNMLWYDPSLADLMWYNSPTAATPAAKDLNMKNVANQNWYPLCGGSRSAAVVPKAMANGPEMAWLHYQKSVAGNDLMMRFVNNSATTGNTFNTRTGFFVLDTTCGGGTPFLDTSVYSGSTVYLQARSNSSSPIFVPRAGHESLAGANSPAYLNGVSVDSSTHTFNSRGEVLSFVFNEQVPIKNFNNYSQSGDSFHTRHGEVLLYNTALTDAQRKDTEAYLMNKWLGTTPAGYGDSSKITIAGAGAVAFASAEHPGFAADYAGNIDASAATKLNFDFDNNALINPIQTSGTLALADAVEVSIDFALVPAAKNGTIVLAKAGAITGGATVTLAASTAAIFTSSSLAIVDNQLVLTYQLPLNLVWKVSEVPVTMMGSFDHAVLVVNEGVGLKALSGNVGLNEIASTSLDDYKTGEYRFTIRLYNANGMAIGESKAYTYAELQDYVEGSSGLLSLSAFTCGEYVLPREDWTALGLTIGQQLTNAVTLAASGATIRFSAGSYDLGEVYMREQSYQSKDATPVTVNSRTHVYIPGKSLHFVGDTDGHWSGAVTLTGSGRFYAGDSGSGATTFKGITFKDFAACDNPSKEPAGGNLTAASYGGVISGAQMTLVTNCVFETCTARSAGAVAYITCYDCKFKGNVASYNGGAGLCGYYYGCRFEENEGVLGSGAIWWPSAVDDSDFIGNHAGGSGGAFIANAHVTYRNDRFIGNYSADCGGAMSFQRYVTAKDCVFVDNHAENAGGAIYADDWTALTSGDQGSFGSKIIGCVFTNNYATAATGRAGAISAKVEYTANGETHYLKSVDILDCTFVGNHAKLSAGAVFGGAISNCVFESNYLAGGAYDANNTPIGGAVRGPLSVSNGLSVIDSVFVSNRIDSLTYAQGVAIYSQGQGWPCVNCRFDGNNLFNTNYDGRVQGKVVFTAAGGASACRMADCLFTNNVIACGGLVNNANVTNTIFVGNDVPILGACVIDSTVYDSVFTDNRKSDRHYRFTGSRYKTARTNYNGAIESNVKNAGVDALTSKLYRCTMDGGVFNDCVLNECVIPKCNSYGSWCVFGYGNYVTNTLVANAGGQTMRSFIYRWGSSTTTVSDTWYNEFVNCTFADNVYSGGNGTPQYFMGCTYKGTAARQPMQSKFINCAFNNNRKASATGAIVDLRAYINAADGVSEAVYANILQVSNCVFGVAPKVVGASNTTLGNYTDLGGNRVIVAEEQKLVKSDLEIARFSTDSYKPAKYTPKGHSPLRGAGDASFYTAESKDAAGNLRVDGGKVDIGCYQSYLPRFGTLFMVK